MREYLTALATIEAVEVLRLVCFMYTALRHGPFHILSHCISGKYGSVNLRSHVSVRLQLAPFSIL